MQVLLSFHNSLWPNSQNGDFSFLLIFTVYVLHCSTDLHNVNRMDASTFSGAKVWKFHNAFRVHHVAAQIQQKCLCCRCTAGWTGVLCDKPAIVQRPPTTTTAKVSPVPNPGSSSQPQLVIQKNKLTPTSVMIILPRIDRQLTVTLFKIKDMAPGNQVLLDTYTIVPTQHPYTVDNLLAGTRYNICITATDFVPNGREIKDKLCGVVRTPPAASVTVRPDPKTENPETGPSPSPDDGAAVDDSSSDGGGHTGGKSSERDSVPDDDFKLLYPAIGAGIGALVILIAIIIFCVCYRKKKKLKRATSTDSGRPVTPKDYADRTTSTPATDIEAVPIMAQQGRVQYIPQPAITTALMQQPSDLYQPQTPQHGFQSVCASPQRVGTPNRTGSLGRSSTSGGSVAGSQAPYALDQQRPCPSDSGYETIRSIPGPAIVDDVGSHTGYHVNGGMYAGHAPYTASQVPCTTAYVPVLTNRNQEYLYMSNGHAGQHAVYADPRFVEHSVQPVVVPVRSTSTTVNQYHQGVISATTVSPESLYTPSAVSNGYTSVPAMPTHYSSHNQMAPRYSASRTPRDAYGPIITSAAFKDTLVMWRKTRLVPLHSILSSSRSRAYCTLEPSSIELVLEKIRFSTICYRYKRELMASCALKSWQPIGDHGSVFPAAAQLQHVNFLRLQRQGYCDTYNCFLHLPACAMHC